MKRKDKKTMKEVLEGMESFKDTSDENLQKISDKFENALEKQKNKLRWSNLNPASKASSVIAILMLIIAILSFWGQAQSNKQTGKAYIFLKKNLS